MPKTIITDTKVLEVQEKILHRCYATNSIISKWDDTKVSICVTCNQKANILHNFVRCTIIQQFWKELSDILLLQNIYDNQLTTIDILFGKFKQIKHEGLNHIILYAKFYIHKCFIQNTNPTVKIFISYYKNILNIEKQMFTERNKLQVFRTRFKKLFNL